MIEWQGIAADTADVDETSGVSALQLNTRMRIDGELQRRYGMLSTGLPPLDGPILYLASGSGFVVRGTATNVDGDPDPVDIPVGPIRRPPIIDVIRQGSGWVLPYASWSGGGRHYAVGFGGPGSSCSCAGTITVNVGHASARLLTERWNLGFVKSYVVDDRTVGPGVGYQINVPWDDQFPFVHFISPVTGLGSSTGQSIGGCGI
jgi:hypothetical protein